MNGATQVWKQTFSYDRFGNRRFDGSNTTLPQITPQNEASTNPTFNQANNRISVAGYRYDLAGNMECDPTHPCGSTAPFTAYYEYDGDNRIKTANGGASSGGSTYIYDGDGRRVKKIVGGPTSVTTVFVYDLAGQMIAEYSDQQQSAGTSYLTVDHLGTPRVITRADGSVSGRHDYQPFGEEIAPTYGGRAGVAGYPASDGLRQQFTQKERDNETGLDYFGARYYGSILGRFSGVDPKMLGMNHIVNPQRWNRYAYVVNNPLTLYDPDGQQDQGKGGGKVIDIFLRYDKEANPKGEDRMTRTQQRELANVRRQAEKKGIQINVREVYDSDADTASRVVGTPGAIVIFGVHTARDETTLETIGPITSTGILARAGIVYGGASINDPYEIHDRGPTQAELVVVMGCDSNESRDAFAGAKNYIGVDGGANHGSSTYGLNQGIITTVKAIVDANGEINEQTLNKIVTNSQKVIRGNEAQGNPDPDDRVILNPAVRLPVPGRRVP